jgi:hypothetical protein
LFRVVPAVVSAPNLLPPRAALPAPQQLDQSGFAYLDRQPAEVFAVELIDTSGDYGDRCCHRV